ncbi:hypothetical protein SC1_00743 [Sphingopyxis sp. C-1]|nr:hypothetical protein SC1_00743 [Sphingopyxis sp. C-1]
MTSSQCCHARSIRPKGSWFPAYFPGEAARRWLYQGAIDGVRRPPNK